MSLNPSCGELRLFDPAHKPVGIAYPAKAINLAWAENDIAPATFTVPMGSLAWATAYTRELNRVEYHHPDLPVVWTGVIVESSDNWPEATLSCNSAEWLYTKRVTDVLVDFEGVETAGQIVQVLHTQAAKRQPLGIHCGAVDLSGPTYYIPFELVKVWDAIKKVCETAGGAAWVEKTGHAHRDPWLLRYARARGTDRSADVVLCAEMVDRPNSRATAVSMANALHVLGASSGSGDGSIHDRLRLYLAHQPSVDVYGLLEEIAEFPDIIDPNLLQEAGGRKLYTLSRLLRTLGLNIDNRREVWGRFWIGDTVRALISRVGRAGLDVLVRVTGIQLNVDAGKLGLTVEVL